MTFLNYCLKVNSIVKFWPAVAVGMAAAASHGVLCKQQQQQQQ